MMWLPTTLRRRLSLAASCVLVVAFLIVAMVLLTALDRMQRRFLDAELVAVATAESTAIDLAPNGLVDADDRRRFVASAGRNVASAVVLPDGRIAVASVLDVPDAVLRSTSAAADRPPATYTDDGDAIRAVSVHLEAAGRRIATIVAWSSLDGVVATDRSVAIILVIIIPIFALAAIVTIDEVLRRGLHPLDAIVNDATRIATFGEHARVRSTATSELNRLADAINAMLERLDDVFEREQRFTADASHELRAPVSIILAEADLALSAQRRPFEYRRALETIALEAEGLELLTRSLLAAARDEAPSGLSIERVAVEEVLSAVIARIDILAASRGIAIERIGAADAAVAIPYDSLERVFLSVLHNAIKHACRTITVTTQVVANVITVQLADDGPGFSESALMHGFERFWREGTSGANGHGLGLAIAREALVPYRATITIANGLEGGAVVTIAMVQTVA